MASRSAGPLTDADLTTCEWAQLAAIDVLSLSLSVCACVTGGGGGGRGGRGTGRERLAIPLTVVA